MALHLVNNSRNARFTPSTLSEVHDIFPEMAFQAELVDREDNDNSAGLPRGRFGEGASS